MTGPRPADDDRGPALEVVDGGVQASVQDGGRPDLGPLGIAPGGAADPWSMTVVNALLDNEPGAAVVEWTLAGAVRALRPVTLALAGADLGAMVRDRNLPVAPGSTVTLGAGEILALGGGPTGAGARAYLAVPGGIDVPLVLGSRATALGAGFGGLDGRALRSGDRLHAGAPGGSLRRDERRWPGAAAAPLPAGIPLRVMPGPHADRLGPSILEMLLDGAWSVSAASDRVGLRLEGPSITRATAEVASHGVVTGAIQLPPDGRPIVLLPDRQPTGGYPVVAVVIAADRARLGQAIPGDRLRFTLVTPSDARRAAAVGEAAFEAILHQVRDADRWDDLWRHAGA